jgi:CRP/FNR family transcriptional regulator, cyclic AMP receptor protein
MSIAEMAGYLAAALVFLTFYMKTMIPLRMIGICSNCMFIIYGSLDGLYPVLVLHLILLPLNGLRLREMLRLTKQVQAAGQGDLYMDWLKPFTSTRTGPRAAMCSFAKAMPPIRCFSSFPAAII